MVSIVSTVSQLIDLCVCAHAEGLNLKTMHNHATMHNSVHLHVQRTDYGLVFNSLSHLSANLEEKR